mmetsp:Transcript_8098/g.8957  ORF Transcript_8098/g.8957 Transcript_8098/m.8957 type:complete len:633 (-) Transcript_8098:253-2151(-)|eukprot:CAMPEP_0194132778 /NCGR_PEP_ID=MMETSP0152-20130528/3165_1 /TAXON_ID=1049557 /ORGANISM="Thalassiothrix antarctica, Strain L6-D1" /LENGTH=632 /DNA_ID=CAMNT_0038827943 /DNA_START=215 /DNA_END=2113 /DNA_ORIENTATION=+
MEAYGVLTEGRQPASLITPVPSSSSSITDNGIGAGNGIITACDKSEPCKVMSAAPVPTQSLSASNGNQDQLPSLPAESNTPHHPIAEFLYQLTKMLTDNNDEIIEWTNGKIKVHHPERLEGEVLHKYFRHSKFASFQRQLNYFGFRKIAGKGKMSPCSYVNDAATTDIRSLLHIKRKTNGSAARKAAMAQRAAAAGALQAPMMMGQFGMPISADFLKQALTTSITPTGLYPGAMFANVHQQAALQHPVMQQQAVFDQQAQAVAQAAALRQQAAAVYQNTAIQQKPLGESLFLPSHNTFAALTKGQRIVSAQDISGFSKKAEQLQQFSAAQQLTAANSALNLAGFGMMQANPTLASAPFGRIDCGAPVPSVGNGTISTQILFGNPSMPATAAVNATVAANAAASNQSNNLFESSTALSALVGNNNMNNPKDGKSQTSVSSYGGSANTGMASLTPALGIAGNTLATQKRLSNNNLLRGLPSAGAMFPDTLSSVSLQGLLPSVVGMSSNRLSSMLSLSGFLSRDPSMADLLPGPSNANLAGLAASAQLGNTTLVPLAGSVSQFGGTSAAWSSLSGTSLSGPALLGALTAGNTPGPAPVAASNSTTIQAPAPSGVPGAGLEPTPIMDLNNASKPAT